LSFFWLTILDSEKLATMPHTEGPDYILEPNPDGPAISARKLKDLVANDSSTLHQNERVWWVKQKQDNVEFAAMVEATDESLRRIRAKLKELGLEENTIIIFTADNGGMSASNQYWHFPHYSNHGFQSPGGAIRFGRYKLLEYYENGRIQLFDLENDIGEQNDFATSQPQIAQRLKKMLHDWRKQVDAKMPYPKTASSKPTPGARTAKPNS
jgi:Sulfatase